MPMTQDLTAQPTRSPAAALPAGLAGARDGLLEGAGDIRLIVGADGLARAASQDGQAHADAIGVLDDAALDAFSVWLSGPDAGEHNLRLMLSGSLHSFMAQKVSLAFLGEGDFWLILLRQPNLSSSLIQALSQSRGLYKDIVQTVPGLVWETRRCGTFNFVSGQQFGGLVHADMVGRVPADCMGIPKDLVRQSFCTRTPVEGIDIWVEPAGGTRLCLSVSAKPVFDASGGWLGARGVALDVTAERLDGEALDQASEALQKSAITDPLTGLLNRRGFEERMTKVCRQLRSADKGGFLALIDLDKFKQLNDGHGHHVGDAALIAVGQMLTRYSRQNDLAARLGGDEFAVWMDACTREGAERVCVDLQAFMPELCETLALPGFGLSLSIGVTAFQPGRDDLEGMLKRADAAMYAVKDNGRGHHKFDEGGSDGSA